MKKQQNQQKNKESDNITEKNTTQDENNTNKKQQITQKQYKLKKKQKQFLELLKKSLGIVSAAVEKSGISRSAHYQWLKNPTYAQEVEEIQTSLKDFGESKFLTLMKENNPQAILHFNKTKNKDRGYGEKLEVENKIKIEQLSDEQCADIIKKLS